MAGVDMASSGDLEWTATGPTGFALANGFSLCVNVDYLGPETNSNPIPITAYDGSLHITGPDVVDGSDNTIVDADDRDARATASGLIGLLGRNGTSVNIAYLTVSEKYNSAAHHFEPWGTWMRCST